MGQQKTLVVTRETHEEVVITTPEGRTITVGIGKIYPKRDGKSRCRVYFHADEDIIINRKEIQDQADRD